MHIEPSSYTCAPIPAPAGENFIINPKSLQQSFQVWLEGMTTGARAERRPAHARLPMTTQERIAVTLATVRERVRHRRWPTEIIDKFLAAEIVTDPLAELPADRGLSGLARRLHLMRLSGDSYTTIVTTLWR